MYALVSCTKSSRLVHSFSSSSDCHCVSVVADPPFLAVPAPMRGGEVVAAPTTRSEAEGGGGRRRRLSGVRRRAAEGGVAGRAE